MASRSSLECPSSRHSAITRFPMEIISLILNQIPHDDLSRIRHINSAFAVAAAPRIFESIPLWLCLNRLESLTELSLHRKLRHYVKEIVFSPLRFAPQEDQDAYLSSVKSSIHLGSDSSSLNTLLLMKHETAYRTLTENQRKLTVDGLDMSILTHAFKRFTNLESLVLDHDNRFIGANLLHRELGSFDSAKLLTWDSTYTFPVLLRALSTAKVQVKRFTLGRKEAPSVSDRRRASLDANPRQVWPHVP